MLNELKYNINNFNNIYEDDVIIVFKGHVYPVYMNNYSKENINYIINIIKELCTVYDGMYDIFFEDNGELKENLKEPYRLFNAFGNFEDLPKLLYGYVIAYKGQYSLAFDYSTYDVANSNEFKQLLNTEIIDQFRYILFNDKAYTVEDIKKNLFQNRKEANTDVTPELYHGTTTKYIYDILTKGLRQIQQNSAFKVANTGYVYLTSVFQTACDYAEMYASYKGGEECVIVVDTNKINHNNLVLDFDVANAFTVDVENSPYQDKIKPNNRFYKGNVAKNASKNGTKYGKVGYKGLIMPNAIKGAYILQNNKSEFLTREQLLSNFRPVENANRRKNMVNEYTSIYFKDKENYTIMAYHTVRRDCIYDIFYDGYLDPKAEHKGECPYNIIWFSISDDYDGSFRFSFEIDQQTFKEMGFKWQNDTHLTTPCKIDVMDKRLRIVKINGVNIDELFKRFYDNTQKGLEDFIERACMLTNNELSNELFIDKLLQQYGFKHSDWFGEEEEDIEESKKDKFIRQGLINYGDGEQLNEVEASNISLKSFEIQDELNPKFWINNKINSRVRLKLLDLADEFIDNLAVDWVKPEDIVLTGSIANYNWSKYSDVDVHILIDFKKVWNKTEFVQDYFDSKKALWSQKHENLKIYGFPVEIYVEDVNQDNPNSGIYSLNKNKWIVKPNDFQDADLNEKYIKEHSARIMTQIDNIEEKIKTEKDNHKLEVLSTKLKNLFDKLHKQRKESLDKHGEMGTYNIIWKVLRRSGHLDKIWEIINTIYNKVNSLK